MVILNTGWTLPYNAVNVICALAIVVLIGMLVALIFVGTTDGFSANLIKWLIVTACIVSMFLAVLIYNMEKTYKIYLDDMTLKELETEYEPYAIDGPVVKCIKKGEKDGR